MAARLTLMRHGVIEANVQGLWHGSTDSKLLPRGLRQARRTGLFLARQSTPPVAIYTSPLQRCQTTAQLIADALNAPLAKAQRRRAWSNRLCRYSFGKLGTAEALPPQPVIEPVVIDDLREYAIGDWEGMSFSELARSHQFFERAMADLEFAPPQGESLRLVSQRISAALQDLHQRHEPHEPVLVVGHGAALGVALATLLNDDPSKWSDYHFDNCSLSDLVFDGLPELQRFNLTGHL